MSWLCPSACSSRAQQRCVCVAMGNSWEPSQPLPPTPLCKLLGESHPHTNLSIPVPAGSEG